MENITPIDHEALRQALMETAGIRLSPDDPVFALLVLNQIVLDAYADTVNKRLEDGSGKVNVQVGQLLDAAQKLQTAISSAVANAEHQVALAAEREVTSVRASARAGAKVGVEEGAGEAIYALRGQITGLAMQIDGYEAAMKEREGQRNSFFARPLGIFLLTFCAAIVGGVTTLQLNYFVKDPVVSAVRNSLGTLEFNRDLAQPQHPTGTRSR